MSKRYSGRPKRTKPWPNCKAAKCFKSTEGGAKGFCHSHYIAARRGRLDMETGEESRPLLRVSSYGPGAHCSVVDCIRKPKANNLCAAHWQAQKAGRPLDLLRPRRKGSAVPCLLKDCESRACSRGMCTKHAEKRRRGLIDEAGKKLRDKKKPGPSRKSDRYIIDGYVLVWAPKGHLNAQSSGKILEHRLVMSNQLGRPLEDHELVHHKDGNRSNNNIDNLQLLYGRSKKGESHPPGSDMDYLVALQIVVQNNCTPVHVVRSIRKLQKQLAA